MNTIITITGPTCSGKSHLERMLAERGMARAISVTTRPMRQNEINGVDYGFVSTDVFRELLADDALLNSTIFNRNFYGVERTEIERHFKMGNAVALVVEPSGATAVRQEANKRGWRVISVFVDNPPKLILGRFLARFAGELARAPSSNDMDRIIRSYTDRLQIMQEREVDWSKDASLATSPYDIVFDEFNEKNANTIANTIMAIVKGNQAIEDAA